MYERLDLGEPKPTRMSLELADRSIQYPRGIVENMLIKVDKFVLPIDFVILDMPKNLRIPIILGRPFLATARAMIDVFDKKITLRVGDDEVVFDMDRSMIKPSFEDDECYGIDDLDDTISKETCKNVEQNAEQICRIKNKHVNSASANKIDNKKPKWKGLPSHLECSYLHDNESFPVIISSKLSVKDKNSLFQVLEKHKGCDDLLVKLNQTEFKASTYKRDLATVKGQLVTYKKNEVLFSEEVVVLKREVACKEYEISVLKSDFEKVKQEKQGIEFKIEKFDNASKSLDKMLDSQITDKSKKGLGYNDVPPPHPLIYNAPAKLDLSYSGLDEFKEPEYTGYGPRNDKQESNLNCDKKSDKETSDDSLASSYCLVIALLSLHLSLITKLFFILLKRKRMVNGNNYNRVDYDNYAKTSHPSIHKNMTPRAVLLKTGLTPLSTVRPVYTAHPRPIIHSARSRPILLGHTEHKLILLGKMRSMLLRPQHVGSGDPPDLMDIPQMNDKGFVDSGCSRHMTGNIAYLTDFKEYDGGYVTFGGGAYGGRITGKGTLKIDGLDFEDIHFVNELKFNLFSVSQMCDKKNYVLFTDSECLVLSPNFKLPDESQILLKIPREDNMYSFDIKNIVPKESLTCLGKGIRREYSVARTPQQNGVAKRRNRTLIEAARTMLADSKLPTTFWAEVVSIACYVQRIEDKPMPEGIGPKWLFDIESLTQSMNYVPVTTGTSTNESAGTQEDLNIGTFTVKEGTSQEGIVMPIWKDVSYFDSSSKDANHDEPQSYRDPGKKIVDGVPNVSGVDN
ncbi:ribonuclease H-like domain-containing protein [Tanacetum coccineum]